MTDYLFDTPFWLPVLLAAAGVVVFVSGNKRLESRVKLAGLGLIGLAVVLAAVSYLVDTPVETAAKRSRQLVRAFEEQDWATMSGILDRNAKLTVLNAMTLYDTREQIVDAAKDAQEKYGFRSVNIIGLTPTRTDTLITVDINLLSEQDAYGGMVNSSWQFDWIKTADGWAMVEVRAMKIGQQEGDNLKPMFPGG